MADKPTPKANLLADAMLQLVLQVPGSTEPVRSHPAERAQAIARKAARTASVVSGSFALPPGILGWLTVMPELVGVWKLQAQMVSDIASVYGKSKILGREQMLYCLFKHMSAQVFRDVVVRVGERVLVRRVSLKVMQSIAEKIGVKVTQRALGKGLSRWIPVIGALGIGAHAYYDTAQVAASAIDLFEREIELESDKQDLLEQKSVGLA